MFLKYFQDCFYIVNYSCLFRGTNRLSLPFELCIGLFPTFSLTVLFPAEQTFKILVCLARVIVEKFNTFFIQIFFDDDAFPCRSEYVKQRYVRFTLFRDQFFALIKRASRRDMATHTLPLLFVNLGGEMLYVLSQRLNSQKVDVEKSQKGSFPFICCFNVSYEL